LAGKEGVTVLWGDGAAGLGAVVELVDEAAGFAVVVEVDVVVAGFAGVVVAGAALDVVVHAARMEEDAKLREDIRYAEGADLDDDAESRAEKPLRAEFVAMTVRVIDATEVETKCYNASTRSHDSLA
jgi:hypothetical protein